MADSRFRIIVTGLWMTALFWPYAHAGGYLAPGLLALTPLFLAVGDLWAVWPFKWATWAFVVLGELYIQWATLPGPQQFFHSLIKSIIALHRIAPSEWNQMSAHLATPLILAGACLGWAVYRQTTSKTRALTLFAVGIITLALNHVLWGLAAEGPLFAYLGLGLLLLLWFQVLRPDHGIMTFHPHRLWYGLAGVSVLVPLVIGWITPPQPGHGYLSMGFGRPSLSGDFGSGTAQTGFADGINHIGHSLVPNYQPVLLIHSPSPHYWQAEIYNNFNGTVWSNPVSQAPYTITSDNSNLPLFPMPFSSNFPIVTQRFRITSLQPGGLSTLFYTGVPIMLSSPGPVTVFPSHEKLVGSHIRAYTVTALVPSYNFQKIAQTPYTPLFGMQEDLATPANLSPKVKILAKQITHDATTPWQAVLDITHYLDAHYRYSYHVTPTRTNVVNHFLFKDPQGYCDQFSTSLIMMLRTLGIPARWVVGYGPGTYSSSKNAYVIRSVDAHSWAEVYVAPYGWIPFDPTPGWSIPQINTGSNSSVPEQVSVPTQPKNPLVSQPKLHLKGPNNTSYPKLSRVGTSSHGVPKTNRTAMVMAFLAILGVAIVAFVRQLSVSKPTAHKLWHQMQFWMRVRHRIPPQMIATPRDFFQAWIRLYDDEAEPLRKLVRLAEKGLYSRDGLLPAEVLEWKSLWQMARRHRSYHQHSSSHSA